MATRVTPDEVKEILDDSDMTDPKLQAFIDGANIFLTSAMSEAGVTLGATLLKEIERWLSAHFVVSAIERMAQKEAAGTAKIEYVGKTGARLDSTTYGQTALLMDVSGALESAGGKAVMIYAVPGLSQKIN